MESLTDQFYSFAFTLIIGALGGFCYDYYRTLRIFFKFKKVGTCLGDIFFWIIITALVFFLLLLGNWGVVRYYVLFGLILGAFTYFQFFSAGVSRLVRFKFNLLKKMWTMLAKIATFLFNAVLLPFRALVSILSYPMSFLRVLYRKISHKLKASFRNLILQRVRRSLVGIKPMLLGLFWRKKND